MMAWAELWANSKPERFDSDVSIVGDMYRQGSR